MMIDQEVVSCSPSSIYRILKRAGLLNKRNKIRTSSYGYCFRQLDRPHQHWHTDIKYVHFRGTFLFLITVIFGYFRYIVHNELRANMKEFDVQQTPQRAREKYLDQRPVIISDNWSQCISKDFTQFISSSALTHIRTSVKYPQSNG